MLLFFVWRTAHPFSPCRQRHHPATMVSRAGRCCPFLRCQLAACGIPNFMQQRAIVADMEEDSRVSVVP